MRLPKTSAHNSSLFGWSIRLNTAVAWVWSMNVAGMKACSSISTDGEGASGSIRKARCTRAISSWDKFFRSRKARSGSSRTAGMPAGSMAPMSEPEPFTRSTAISPPARSRAVVFSEVLPPPCRTSR